MSDTLLTPTAGSLIWLGATARVITIGLVLTGYAPGLATGSDPHVCLPSAGSLTFTGSSPDLTTMGLRLRGYPPGVATHLVAIPTGAGSLTLAGAIPAVTNTNLPALRTPTTGSLTFTGQAPTIPLSNVTMSPGVGSLSTVRETFPTTGILDYFDRTDENPVNTNWDVLKLARSECRLISNVVRAPAAAVGFSYWASNNFGPESEIYATVITRPVAGEHVAFYLRLASPNSASMQGYKALFLRSATANQLTIQLIRVTGNNETVLLTRTDVATWADADQIGFSCLGSVLHVWHRPNASVWRVLDGLTDTTYPNSGNLGIEISDLTTNGTALNDLGGGTNVHAPDAPYVQPNIGLRLIGYAPILLRNGEVRKDPLAGSLTLTGITATVASTQPIAITPGKGTLTLTPFLSGVFGGSWVITPAQATLTLSSTQQITPSTADPLKCQPWAEIRWLANTESDLAGYNVYHGVVSTTYLTHVDVGNVLHYAWNDLPYGNNYFVVTAYDTAVPPNESVASAEVSTFISGSGFAPTLTNSTPSSRTPLTGSLTMTGFAPSIQAYQVTTAGALTLTGEAPLIGLGIVTPDGTLTLTGLAPVGTGAFTDVPAAGALVLTGYAPTSLEEGTFTIRPGVGSLTLTGAAPTVPAPWQASLAVNANQVLDAGGSPLDA